MPEIPIPTKFYGQFDAKGTLVEIDPILYGHYVTIHNLGIPLSDETYSMEFCRPYFKNRIFYDIGAYLGLWSVFALMNGAKHVFAFDLVREDCVPIQYKNYTRLQLTMDNAINTMDNIARSHGIPGIIKIDVDGDEIEILCGAKDVLKSKPVIMIEVHPGYGDGVKAILGKPTREMQMGTTKDHVHMFYNI